MQHFSQAKEEEGQIQAAHAKGKISRVRRTLKLANTLPTSYQTHSRVERELLADAQTFSAALLVAFLILIS